MTEHKGAMTKATLKETFAALRAGKFLTLAQIAKKCAFDETTVLKVEGGRPVRWETLHLILSVGMGVHPGTDKYEECHRLWLRQRQEMAESKPTDKGDKKLSVHAAAALREFRAMVRDMDAPAVSRLMMTVRRSAGQLG